MRDDIRQYMWLKKHSKNRPHWAILTLNDLDQTNHKHSQLITLFQAKYLAARGPGKDKPDQKSEDL